MDNIFVVALVVAIIYLICKFLEMRFILKETRPLKILIRETLVVYFSVVLGNFIMEQMKNGKKLVGGKVTNAFLGKPDF